MVHEVGVIEPAGDPSRAGRREVLVDLAPDGGIVVGVYIGVQEAHVCLGGPRADMRVKGSLALALHDLLYAPPLTIQSAPTQEAAS
jgi:hypothetical protein